MNHRILFVVSLFFFAFQGGYSEENESPKLSPDTNMGIAAALQGDTDKAGQLFRQANAKHPEDAPSGVSLALIFNKAQRTVEARFWLEKTADDYPDDPEAFLMLGQIAYEEQRLTEARLLAVHGLGLAEKYSQNPRRKQEMEIRGQSVLAAVEETKCHWAAAEKCLERLVELQPENAESMVRLGILQLQLEKTDAGIQTIDKAHAIDGKIPPGLAAAAQFFQFNRSEKQELSKKYLEQAIEKFPGNPKVLQTAASLEIQWGDLKSAREHAEKVLEIEPKNRDAILVCGLINLFEKDYPKAESLYHELIFVNPSDPQAMEGLALALCEQKDELKFQQALMYAKTVQMDYPEATDALCTLAWVSYKAGESRKPLLDYLEKLSYTGRLNALGAYCYGVVLAENGKTDTAMIMLKRAVEGKTNFPKREDAAALLKKLEAE